jgi:hypothetical protein
MLVTVEAPREGDPIFTLRRALPPFEEGTIFVRRNGQTQRASSQEIIRLTDRACSRGDRLDVTVVRQDESPLTAFKFDDGDGLTAFVESEAERLRRFALPGGLAGITSGVREGRDPSRYDASVQSYLDRIPRLAPYRAGRLAIERQLATVNLVINTESALNFAGTQVVLRFPKNMLIFFDTDRIADTLEKFDPPDAWGSRSAWELPRFTPPSLRSVLESDGREIDRKGDAVVVTLPPVHVRPHTPAPLLPIYLVLPESMAGATFLVPWRATSTSAEGFASGEIELSIANEATDLSEFLFAAPE